MAAVALIPGCEDSVAEYLRRAIDRDTTRESYGRAIRLAVSAMNLSTLQELTPSHLEEWRAAFLEDARWSQPTKRRDITALRSFLRWARLRGASPLSWEEVERTLRIPRGVVVTPIPALPDDLASALFLTAGEGQERALLTVMLGAGLRLGEVVRLDVGDVLTETPPRLYIRQGKGGKDRLVPLGPDSAAILLRFTHGRPPSEPLFTRDGRRLSGAVIQRTLLRLARTAGLTNVRVSTHALRHTYAVRALRHSGSILAVSKLLGHTSVMTTQRYVDHLAFSELALAVPPLPAVDA